MFDELRAKVEAGDGSALKAFVQAAMDEDRRPEAIALLKPRYEPGRPRDLWEALRELMTYPEFAKLPPPPEVPDARRVTKQSYVKLLGAAFGFPFRSAASVTVILLGGLVFAGSMKLIQLAGCMAMPLVAAATGYMVAYWFNVVLESAEGSKRPPGWPSGEDVLDYIGHFIRWWLATFAATLPAAVFLGVWLRAAQESESAVVLLHPALIGAVVAGLAGVLYYPMALLLAAFGGAWWTSINLRMGLSGIRRLGGDYFVCVGFFVVTFAVATAIEVWMARTFTGFAFVAARMAGAWLTFTMTAIQMRALGLLYYVRSQDLGWFRQ